MGSPHPNQAHTREPDHQNVNLQKLNDATTHNARDQFNSIRRSKNQNRIPTNNNRQNTIQQIEVNELLDSGASISLLGKECDQYLCHWPGVQRKSVLKVKTAEGRVNECNKTIILPISFKGMHRNVRFYITPTIYSSTIFGMNFWQAFNIQPVIRVCPGPFRKRKSIRQHKMMMIQNETFHALNSE